MIDSLSLENVFPWNWGRWRLLVAYGRVVEGVVFLEYSIGGFGCLGAADLAHCLARVSTTCALLGLVFPPGSPSIFDGSWFPYMLSIFGIWSCRLSVLVSLVFLVALPELWAVFIWIPARDVGSS